MRIRIENGRVIDPGNLDGVMDILIEDGKIIGLVEGFDHVSLPKGPDDLLAVITLAEKQIGRSIVKTRRAIIHELDTMDHLDVQQMNANHSASLSQWLNLQWLPVD